MLAEYSESGMTMEKISSDVVWHHATVQRDHRERCGGGAFLFVATDVDVDVIGSPIRQAVNQPGIAMEVKNDGLVSREERIEVGIRQSMRMFRARL